MPWIDLEDCDGCGVCVEECPVDTIIFRDEEAEIIMDGCIRCGVCHDICPQDAIKHDSEKTPEKVAENIEITKNFMELCVKHLGDEKEAAKCLKRMIKHFNNQRAIAEKTLTVLKKMSEELQ